jgi:hypothetical protein
MRFLEQIFGFIELWWGFSHVWLSRATVAPAAGERSPQLLHSSAGKEIQSMQFLSSNVTQKADSVARPCSCEWLFD